MGVALAAIAAVAVPDADLRGQSHPRVLILTPSSAIKDGLMRKCRRMFRTLGMDEMSSVIELCANGSSVAGTASDFQDQRVTE